MTHAVELTFDLDFRGDDALAHSLGRAGWESQGGDPAACGWTIVASFIEFASGDFDGLHLTGMEVGGCWTASRRGFDCWRSMQMG